MHYPSIAIIHHPSIQVGFLKVSLFYLQFGGPMPGVPAQGMAMPGMPAAGGYPAQQAYGAYQGSFPASPAQDPMWGYFTAIAGQVRAAGYLWL